VYAPGPRCSSAIAALRPHKRSGSSESSKSPNQSHTEGKSTERGGDYLLVEAIVVAYKVEKLLVECKGPLENIPVHLCLYQLGLQTSEPVKLSDLEGNPAQEVIRQ
jgi:hypothetical protein